MEGTSGHHLPSPVARLLGPAAISAKPTVDGLADDVDPFTPWVDPGLVMQEKVDSITSKKARLRFLSSGQQQQTNENLTTLASAVSAFSWGYSSTVSTAPPLKLETQR